MNVTAAQGALTLEPVRSRVRAVVDGVTIADSQQVINLLERSYRPVFYFPLSDVRRDLLMPTAHTSVCGLKGEANYYSIRLESGRVIDNAVWQYAHPKQGLSELADRVAFYSHFVEFVVGG